jgi:hypothetical protein
MCDSYRRNWTFHSEVGIELQEPSKTLFAGQVHHESNLPFIVETSFRLNSSTA